MNNFNAKYQQLSLTPNQLHHQFPLPPFTQQLITQSRIEISNILHGHSNKFLVIVGPCSIHDPQAALAYAELLKQASRKFSQKLFIIMRVYFEKPRTSLGWKGSITDPFLNGDFQIEIGLRRARKLLLEINNLGIPCATEFLDPIIPAFLADLIAWSAIGARTSASPLHRELASALPMPVGMKNTIDGNISVALEAIKVASTSHAFLSIDGEGKPVIVKTVGNTEGHLVLRGSYHEPNYDAEHVMHAIQMLKQNNINKRLIIDCSHGNSMKDFRRQKDVLFSVIEQIQADSRHIAGVMLESNLVAGNQISLHRNALNYGQSITDGCLSWEETLPLLQSLATGCVTPSMSLSPEW